MALANRQEPGAASKNVRRQKNSYRKENIYWGMIRNIEIGEKSKNVVEVKFESGDIMMTRVQLESGLHSLVFNEQPDHEIGETTDDYKGKTTDEFPSEIRVCFTFTNPRSLNALIHSLVELQKDVLREESIYKL